MAITEYQPGTTFPGVIARTADESTPAWPAPKRPAEDAPNVVFIVLDDTGYGHLGSYGSPISTPNIDALAADGLTYANMNTTALCSPSRSCILNGRNHHSNHLACLTNGSTGYPGSDGYIPFENGFLSEILRAQGYNTYCVGKWHLAPEETMTAAGPYDRWPLGRGFERYYGFLGGDTHQYYPELVRDNSQTEPETTPEQGYHLTPDLVEKATAMIADAKQVAPNKPFFLYFAPGAMHSPHHVPKEWADRYAGKFDAGWEVYRREVFERQKQLGLVPATAELSAPDPDVADWETLSADERRLYSRMMEVFAGFLEHTDHYIGELVQFLKDLGEYDNTVIMLISDNGSSAEGGPTGSVNEVRFFNNVPDTVEEGLARIDEIGGPTVFNHFPWGWTHAGNTPFRRWKRETYRGGSTDPFIVTWPRGITARGELRSHYAHIIDMVPTVLEALDIDPPPAIAGVTQSPIEGVSFAHTFDDAAAPDKASDPILRDARPPVALPRRLARRMPLAGAIIRRIHAQVRRSHLRRHAQRARRDGLGALPRRRGRRRDHQPGRTRARAADRDDHPLVQRGRQVQRAADRQPRRGPHRRRAPADRSQPQPLRALPGHPVDHRGVGTEDPQPALLDQRRSRAHRRIGRSAAVHGRQRRRNHPLRQGRRCCATRTTTSPRRSSPSDPMIAYPPGGTSCPWSSRRQVNRMSRTARALRAP